MARKKLKVLPVPPVPENLDLRDVEPPWETFVEMAMQAFGVTREKAEQYVDEVKRREGFTRH